MLGYSRSPGNCGGGDGRVLLSSRPRVIHRIRPRVRRGSMGLSMAVTVGGVLWLSWTVHRLTMPASTAQTDETTKQTWKPRRP